jgi:hypothetical protein
MDNIAIEIEEYKAKFNLNIINSNTMDLKKALKAIAIVSGPLDFNKIDTELDNLVKDLDKLKEIFNVFANLLNTFEKDSKEYNGILAIICSIDYEINNL